jgi:predicted negative regulator of RcsB-dependent stress response
VARYFAGVTLHEIGDNTGAEKDLQDVAGSRYQEIASLAKLALASIYHDTNRDPQAIEIYKQLADHPTLSVGKSTAQFLLASLYEEANQPDQARKLYQQMQKENPSSPAAQMAGQRLQALK